jgi:hypothetical protein
MTPNLPTITTNLHPKNDSIQKFDNNQHNPESIISLMDEPTIPLNPHPPTRENNHNKLQHLSPLLPISRSDHPLDLNISSNNIDLIKQVCSRPPTTPLQDAYERLVGY